MIFFFTYRYSVRWKYKFGQQVGKGLAKGNHGIIHNFIIVLPEETKENHQNPLASNFADI
jgi:hypothetical protein